MSGRKIILSCVAMLAMAGALFASAAGVWLAVSPRLTLRSMVAAAGRGDNAAFLRYIDLSALRNEARGRAARAIQDGIPDSSHVMLNPRALAEIKAGAVIDRIYSPQGVAAFLRTNRAASGRIDYEIIHLGCDHFVARFDYPVRIDLRFARSGLSWRLDNITARRPLPVA